MIIIFIKPILKPGGRGIRIWIGCGYTHIPGSIFRDSSEERYTFLAILTQNIPNFQKFSWVRYENQTHNKRFFFMKIGPMFRDFLQKNGSIFAAHVSTAQGFEDHRPTGLSTIIFMHNFI